VIVGLSFFKRKIFTGSNLSNTWQNNRPFWNIRGGPHQQERAHHSFAMLTDAGYTCQYTYTKSFYDAQLQNNTEDCLLASTHISPLAELDQTLRLVVSENPTVQPFPIRSTGVYSLHLLLIIQ
jgi:hypothetical protein